MTDPWRPRRARPRRKRFGELSAGITARTASALKPEKLAAQRDRQALSKRLLSGGKSKGADEYGPAGQAKKLDQ